MSNIKFPDPWEQNIREVLARISSEDRVLDVGGWWKPFNRADVVVDLLPYESRGGGGSIGPGPERFDGDNWLQMDICTEPLPFADNAFDFVYCGQTLEDIRDPIRVTAELCRVAKAGYIEVPSIWIECAYGIDALPNTDDYPGYEKHRWLVHYTGDRLEFIPKLSWMSLYRFLPKDVFEQHRSRQQLWTTAVHWEGGIEASEWSFVGQAEIVPFLENYFASYRY